MKCKYCGKNNTELKISNTETRKIVGNFCNFTCFKYWKLKVKKND